MIFILKSGVPSCVNRDKFINIDEYVYNESQVTRECPLECSSYTYAFSMSYNEFPTKNLIRKSLKTRPDYFQRVFGRDPVNITTDLFKASFLSAFIYFDEFTITEITEKPAIDLTTLIANLGGTIGLFLGFSLMSAVEMLELSVLFFYVFITNYYKRYKQNRIHVIQKQ